MTTEASEPKPPARKTKKTTKASKGAASKAKGTAGKPKPVHGAKSEFVRANGSLKAKDLVAKAKREGISLSTAYIYALRGKKDVGKKRGGSASETASSFAALLAKLGLDRAEEMMEQFRKAVSRISIK
jgi:hypothetical protein